MSSTDLYGPATICEPFPESLENMPTECFRGPCSNISAPRFWTAKEPWLRTFNVEIEGGRESITESLFRLTGFPRGS